MRMIDVILRGSPGTFASHTPNSPFPCRLTSVILAHSEFNLVIAKFHPSGIFVTSAASLTDLSSQPPHVVTRGSGGTFLPF
jgi:hypothetical protein